MPWIVVDLLMVVVALVCLLLCGLSLWRAVKGLTKDVAAAGSTVGQVTDQLARLQPPPSGRHLQPGRDGAARVR